MANNSFVMPNCCAFLFTKAKKKKLETDEMLAAECNFLAANLTFTKFGRYKKRRVSRQKDSCLRKK
jgi:hypothetical protein